MVDTIYQVVNSTVDQYTCLWAGVFLFYSLATTGKKRAYSSHNTIFYLELVY